MPLFPVHTRRAAVRPAPKLLILLCALLPLGLSLGLSQLHAQAYRYTAARKADLQLGGGISVARSDLGTLNNPYGSVKMIGFGLYGTYDFRPHIGVEVAFHQVNSKNGENTYERTYEVGGRYVWHFNRFHPYGRVMYGRGVFNFPEVNNIPTANLAYNMAVGGAGVDINVQKHINVRVDYEYEHWFSFPVKTLNPQLGTVGVAYHF